MILALLLASALLPGPMPPGAFVVAGGHRLHYYRAGQGEVVLFLHGFGGNGTNWAAQVPALTPHFTVIALDELGFGESAKPKMQYDCDVLAKSAVRFLDALNIRKATVVGASMGGDVAARIAARFPDRVQKLVLMDASGLREPSDPPAPDIPRDPQTLAEQTELLRVLFDDPAEVTPEVVRQRLEAHLASHDSYTRTHFGGDTPPRPLLRKITAPTLVIRGEHDRLVSQAEGLRFAREIPGARLVVIPKSAHVPQMEQPDVFNKVLFDFLRGESPRR